MGTGEQNSESRDGRVVSGRKALLLGALVGCLIALSLFHDLFGRSLSRTIWADTYDPRLIHWILEWGYHALWAKRDVFSFWDANTFYPHTKSLAFSDSLLSLQLIYTPLRAAGLASWPALYTTLCTVLIVGCALSAYALGSLRRLDTFELATVVLCAHGGLSVANFAGHYQLFGVHLALPCILGALSYWWRPGWGSLILTVLSGVFAVCCATYLAPMLVSFALPALAAVAWRAVYLRKGIFRDQAPEFRTLLSHGVFVVVTAGALCAVQLAPYLVVFHGGGGSGWSEHRPYSARPWSIFTHLSSNSYWYRPWADFADTEIAYAPGFVAIILAATGMVFALRLRRRGEMAWASLLSFIGCGVMVCAWLLSLGPRTFSPVDLSLPFEWLAVIVPGLERIRAPGRFGMFVGLGVGLMALPLLVQLSKRGGWRWLVLILLTVESFPSYQSFTIRPGDTTIHREVAKMLPPRTPLIELPAAGRDPLGTVTRTLAQLEGSLIHWGWLVAGYGGRSTPEFTELERLDRELQLGERGLREVLLFADKIGVRYLLVHVGRYRARVGARIRKAIKHNPSITLLARHRGSVLLKLTPGPSTAPPRNRTGRKGEDSLSR